jgi:hypothetical protein
MAPDAFGCVVIDKPGKTTTRIVSESLALHGVPVVASRVYNPPSATTVDGIDKEEVVFVIFTLFFFH